MTITLSITPTILSMLNISMIVAMLTLRQTKYHKLTMIVSITCIAMNLLYYLIKGTGL